MGLDPKNPNSTLLAAMAAMDPTGQQLAAMYGMMPPGYPGMPGMDMFGKGKHSPTSKDKNPAPSPRSSQRDGPSPRPPSRASVSSKDGKDGRSTPSRSSVGPTEDLLGVDLLADQPPADLQLVQHQRHNLHLD